MKAVILAAGKGTRMRGLCAATPKPMLPLANRPILSTIFSYLRNVDVEDVALVVGFEGDQLKELVGDGNRYGLRVTYVWQEEQLGTAHATWLCEEFIGRDPFVLIFGDILTRGDNYPAMAKRFHDGSCDAVLTVFPVDDPSQGAAVDVEDGLVRGIFEKPPPGTMPNAYNNAGIFIWPAEILDCIRDLELSPRGEYEFTDGIIRYIEEGHRVAAYELKGYWENITDPEACIRMNQNLLADFLPPDTVTVDEAAQVADGARISQSGVAAGAQVGAGCVIEDSRLEAGCTLAANVSVRHAEVAAGAQIGEGCRIGPYASIGPDAVIGAKAAIGPNASVGEGCRVGPGASLTSSILLPGAALGANGSLMHAMVAFDKALPDGEKIAGTPEQASEVLNE
jgi:NDP-sugar pyrophosphorylase family protein